MDMNENSERHDGICYAAVSSGHFIRDGKEYNSKGECMGEAPRMSFPDQSNYEQSLKTELELLTSHIKYSQDESEEETESFEGLDWQRLEMRVERLLLKIAKKRNDYFSPIPWDEFKKTPVIGSRWRINNLIPFEGLVILASPSGERKTWFALEMARCVALGIPFLGNEEFATIAGNVLYLDAEMSKGELLRRGTLLGFNEVTGNKLWAYSADGLNLNDEKQVDNLMDFIKINHISLVFIDTLRAIAGGLKEEKAEEVRAFFNLFKPVKDMGVALVFIDHCRKPLQNEGRTPKKEQLFASQDKLASVEVLLMVRSDLGKDELLVYQNKNRLGKEYEPFKVAVTDELDDTLAYVERITMKYEGVLMDDESKKDEAKEIILTSLSEGAKKRKELLRIAKAAGVGSKNASDALREMQDAGTIAMRKVGRENEYFLPIETETVAIEQGNVIDSN